MNKIIDLVAKFSGFNWIWAKTDGLKTKSAGVAMMLTGLASLINELTTVIQTHSFGAVLTFIQLLPNDASWLTFLSGLGILGIGCKIDKAAKP